VIVSYLNSLPHQIGHSKDRMPVRAPTILEPQWYLNKEVR
ncbi:hypothetical protein EZS27_034096, partial [termite gut metagenome]